MNCFDKIVRQLSCVEKIGETGNEARCFPPCSRIEVFVFTFEASACVLLRFGCVRLDRNNPKMAERRQRQRLRALRNDRNLARFVVEGRANGIQLGTGSYGSVEEVYMISDCK